MEDIAIVGGGPAGSYLGYCLSKKGMACRIFDGSHPREKPCGGGITTLAIRKFPLLRKLPLGKVSGTKMVIVSPSGRRAMIEGMEDSWNVSRARMDWFLLQQAVSSGAGHVGESVTGIRKTGSGWKLRTPKGFYGAKTVIGADGVNSLVRRTVAGPFRTGDLGFCYGCFTEPLEGMEDTEALMEFFRGMLGYAWVFPREEDCSIGIGTDVAHVPRARNELAGVVKKYASGAKVLSRWGALIPSAGSVGFFDAPAAGKDWMLIGDAAGHVDPITGEGIIYALWSASLAADALQAGDLSLYDRMWRAEYGRTLRDGVRSRRLYYSSALIELGVGLAGRSGTFGRLLYDSINDEIGYGDFTGSVLGNLPRVLWEAFLSRGKVTHGAPGLP